MPVGRTNRREFIAGIGGRCGRSWRAAKRQQDANAELPASVAGNWDTIALRYG